MQFSPNCTIYVQTQVAEYKQLKDTLNRIPSFRNPDPVEQQNVTFPHGTHPPQGYNGREKLTGELQEVRSWGSPGGEVPSGAVLRRTVLCMAHFSYQADS